MKTEIQILWFKKDFRVIDHAPLMKAFENKIPVLPIYLIEPSFWKQPFSSKRHWSFIRDCLIDLQRDLINLRSKLHGLGVEMVGELPEMADKSGSVSIPLSKFGGVYGKTGEEPAGEVKNDDGIERQLKLRYETLNNGACKVYAELA